jgi:signal transduction histidine kinase
MANAFQINQDSLEVVLSTKKGRERMTALNEISAILRENDQRQAFIYSKEADSLATVYSDTSAKSRALENIGWIYYRQGQWQRSLTYSSEAFRLAHASGDKLQAARLMNNLGAISYEQRDYEKAIVQFKEGYELATEVNDLATRIRSLNNVALNFSKAGNQDSALVYVQRSIRLNKDAGSPYLTSFAHRIVGDIYLSNGNSDTAQYIYKQSLDMSRKQGVKSLEAGVLYRLGNAYFLSGKLEEAKEVLLEAIDFNRREGFLDELASSHKFLSLVYEKEGNIRKAYEHLKDHESINDSLVDKSNRDRLVLLQNVLEDDLEKSELELLKAQNENQAYRLKTARGYTVFFAVTAILIAVLGIRLFFMNKSVRTINSDLISQQRKIEDQNLELERQSLQLKGINETKNKLFSILGHDLRGPVAQVKSVVDLLLVGHLEKEEFNELLGVLSKDIDSVNFTLINTLKWSMSQMEGFRINPSPFNLKDVVDNSLKLLDASFKGKQLTVFNQMESKVEVFADQDLIEVVIRNILNNAAKFSNNGDAVTTFSEQDGQWIYWWVMDQGAGMTQEQVELILSDSYSLTKSRPGTNKEKGSGLGLQLVKEFTRKSGGEISIDSHLGHGTKLCVKLPSRNSMREVQSV